MPPEWVVLLDELFIDSIRLDTVTNQPVIILRQTGTARLLPIWIGSCEATAIALELEGVKSSRPMTHDLLVAMIEALGAGIESVMIKDMVEGTYYAVINLTGADAKHEIDSRPSDAIALAVRTGCPIYVSSKLADGMLDVSGESEPRGDAREDMEEWRHFLENLKPGDFQ